MTERDLAADRAACDAATGGPWLNAPREAFPEMKVVFRGCGQDVLAPADASNSLLGDDAKFAAKARTGWPWAIDEIERLRAENETLRAQLATVTPEISDNEPLDCFFCDGLGLVCERCEMSLNECECEEGPLEHQCADCDGTGIERDD